MTDFKDFKEFHTAVVTQGDLTKWCDKVGITVKDAKDIEKEAIEDIKKASEFAKDSPFPDPAAVEDDVYA